MCTLRTRARQDQYGNREEGASRLTVAQHEDASNPNHVLRHDTQCDGDEQSNKAVDFNACEKAPSWIA